MELLVVQIHTVAHDPRVHRRRDFGSTGGLGSIADGAGQNGHGIDHRMRHRRIAAAAEVADTGACAYPGGNGAAVGGKPADATLLVDGDQIGHGQRPQKLLPGGVHALGVADHRHGGGNALIA